MKKLRVWLFIVILVLVAPSHAQAGWYDKTYRDNSQGSLGLTWVPVGSHAVGYLGLSCRCQADPQSPRQ